MFLSAQIRLCWVAPTEPYFCLFEIELRAHTPALQAEARSQDGQSCCCLVPEWCCVSVVPI